MLFWPALIWHIFLEKRKISWLPSKIKVVGENLHFQRQTNFLVKLAHVSRVPLKNKCQIYFIFFFRHLVIAVSKRKIGHLTSDNHAIWMLDGVSIVSLARSDLHLRPVYVLLFRFYQKESRAIPSICFRCPWLRTNWVLLKLV